MARDAVEKKKKRIERKTDVNEREKKRIGANEVVLREKAALCAEHTLAAATDVTHTPDPKNLGKKEPRQTEQRPHTHLSSPLWTGKRWDVPWAVITRELQFPPPQPQDPARRLDSFVEHPPNFSVPVSVMPLSPVPAANGI